MCNRESYRQQWNIWSFEQPLSNTKSRMDTRSVEREGIHHYPLVCFRVLFASEPFRKILIESKRKQYSGEGPLLHSLHHYRKLSSIHKTSLPSSPFTSTALWISLLPQFVRWVGTLGLHPNRHAVPRILSQAQKRGMRDWGWSAHNFSNSARSIPPSSHDEY